VEGFASQLKEAISKEDYDTMKSVQEQLQQALYSAGASVYQQAAAGGGGQAPGNGASSGGGSTSADDVIDAEFTESK
jgi:molecular chaperone DnaK